MIPSVVEQNETGRDGFCNGSFFAVTEDPSLEVTEVCNGKNRFAVTRYTENPLDDSENGVLGGGVTVTHTPYRGVCKDRQKNALVLNTTAHTPYVRVRDSVAVTLGLPSLHPHQSQAIDAAASGRDVLLVAPTGSGKTGAFLGVGLARGGLTLVVSPLRSLIADQKRRLEERGLPVKIWNSDVKDADKEETVADIAAGWSGFLYTTPESLQGRTLSLALTGRVNLAVIDEAHCTLKDRGFRVSYAWLGSLLDRIGPQLRFACTATLPSEDRNHLIASLRLKNPETLILPVARGNLEIQIVERSPWILPRILEEHDGEAGIIFAATVRTAEKLLATLQSQGRNVGLYHGRLSAKAKKRAQTDFMSGDVPVMIATDAFLLGIDKADLRFVVHYDFPKSIEDWAQGFGRAGRDGLPADVFGCFSGADEGLRSRRFLIDSTYPGVDAIYSVWVYIVQAPYRDQTQSEIGVKALGPNGKYCGAACIAALQRHNLCEALPHPDDKRKRRYQAKGDFEATDWSKYEREARQCRDRFHQMVELARLSECDIPSAIDFYFQRDCP